MKDQKLRDEMMYFYGGLGSLQCLTDPENARLQDLLDLMIEQYKSFMKEIWEYEDE